MNYYCASNAACCVAVVLVLFTNPVFSAVKCESPLLDSDVDGLRVMFSPPYSPNLAHMGGPIADGNFARKLTKADMGRLKKDAPTLVASAKLSAPNAKLLKDTLNTRAQSQIPGWFSTAVGFLAPAAWMGTSADVLVQLINGAGDAGRLKLANVAGTVSEGGHVAVHERVANDSAGKLQFVWLLSYIAILNGKPTTALLSACRADVVELP